MPHCTNNFSWYLSKFLAGFTGMLFFYVCFLKEKEYSCLCKARMREFLRDRGEKRPDRCECEAGTLFSIEDRPRFMLVVAENLLTWYAGIREWFLENDPAISETAFVLRKEPPKNDNGVSPANCACCVTLLNRKIKNQLAESTTSVRRKRLGQHCLFRHCSGIVSAEKLLKRRRKRSCVHMHVSQDNITDFWKFCSRNMNDESWNQADNIAVANPTAGLANLANEDTNIVNERKETIRKKCCDRLSRNVRSIETETNLEDALQEKSQCADEIPSKSCIDDVNAKVEVSIDSSCNIINMDAVQPADQHIQAIYKEQNYFCSTSKQVSTEDITDSQTVNKIYDGDMKSEERPAFYEKLITTIDSNKYDCSSKESKKESQSETSFTETIITDNCIDSILYRELREKRAPKTKKKKPPVRLNYSKSVESKLSLKAENNKKPQYSNVENKTQENCLQSAFVKEYYQPNPEYSVIERSLASGSRKGLHDEPETGSTCLNACETSETNQKNFHGNCSCDSKSRNRPLWNVPQKISFTKFNTKISQQRCKTICENSQPKKNNFLDDDTKLKRIIDTMFDRKSTLASEKCFTKCKTSFPQNMKKVTANTAAKVKNSKSRSFKDQKYEDSTDNSSTISSASSGSGNRVSFRYPYKSTMHNQHIRNRSSPTNRSSWRRCPSCTVLFEHLTCHKREPISNVYKWRRREPRRQSPTSTSSTSLASSLNCREDCGFERNNVDQDTRVLFKKSNQTFDEGTANVRERKNRSFRESRLYEQGTKNRIMYTDDRRVTWGFKCTY